MTIYEAIKELEMVQKKMECTEKIRDQIACLSERVMNAKNPDSMDVQVQYSVNVHALEDEIVKLMDMEASYVVFMNRMKEETLKVKKKMMRLLYPYNRLLYLRYIEDKSFKYIAGELGYGIEYCKALSIEGIKLYMVLKP